LESINQSQIELTEEDKISEALVRTKQALQNYLLGKGPEPPYPESFVSLVKANG